MNNLQVEQLIFWIGVILVIPTFRRFCNAASSLLWRRLFPTRLFEFRYLDEKNGINRSILIKVPRKRGKALVDLLDEAVKKDLQDNE